MDTQQQKRLHVLVAGDSCVDIYRFGTCRRKSPEAPVMVYDVIGEEVEERPGMASNVVANLESLGAVVDRCVPPSLITKTRFVDAENNHHVMRIDVDVPIREIDVEDVAHISWTGVDALVIADYCKGSITRQSAYGLVSAAQERGIPVFVDTKKHDLSSFAGCIVKMNDHEAATLPSNAARDLELIITRGKKGVSYNETLFPAHHVEQVYDVCGAGDVFMAGLVTAYCQWPCTSTHERITNAIKFANHCAALSVHHFGTYVLSELDLVSLKEEWTLVWPPR